jgi:hypothetical protein
MIAMVPEEDGEVISISSQEEDGEIREASSDGGEKDSPVLVLSSDSSTGGGACPESDRFEQGPSAAEEDSESGDDDDDGTRNEHHFPEHDPSPDRRIGQNHGVEQRQPMQLAPPMPPPGYFLHQDNFLMRPMHPHLHPQFLAPFPPHMMQTQAFAPEHQMVAAAPAAASSDINVLPTRKRKRLGKKAAAKARKTAAKREAQAAQRAAEQAAEQAAGYAAEQTAMEASEQAAVQSSPTSCAWPSAQTVSRLHEVPPPPPPPAKSSVDLAKMKAAALKGRRLRQEAVLDSVTSQARPVAAAKSSADTVIFTYDEGDDDAEYGSEDNLVLEGSRDDDIDNNFGEDGASTACMDGNRDSRSLRNADLSRAGVLESAKGSESTSPSHFPILERPRGPMTNAISGLQASVIDKRRAIAEMRRKLKELEETKLIAAVVQGMPVISASASNTRPAVASVYMPSSSTATPTNHDRAVPETKEALALRIAALERAKLEKAVRIREQQVQKQAVPSAPVPAGSPVMGNGRPPVKPPQRPSDQASLKRPRFCDKPKYGGKEATASAPSVPRESAELRSAPKDGLDITYPLPQKAHTRYPVDQPPATTERKTVRVIENKTSTAGSLNSTSELNADEKLVLFSKMEKDTKGEPAPEIGAPENKTGQFSAPQRDASVVGIPSWNVSSNDTVKMPPSRPASGTVRAFDDKIGLRCGSFRLHS